MSHVACQIEILVGNVEGVIMKTDQASPPVEQVFPLVLGYMQPGLLAVIEAIPA